MTQLLIRKLPAQVRNDGGFMALQYKIKDGIKKVPIPVPPQIIQALDQCKQLEQSIYPGSTKMYVSATIYISSTAQAEFNEDEQVILAIRVHEALFTMTIAAPPQTNMRGSIAQIEEVAEDVIVAEEGIIGLDMRDMSCFDVLGITEVTADDAPVIDQLIAEANANGTR